MISLLLRLPLAVLAALVMLVFGLISVAAAMLEVFWLVCTTGTFRGRSWIRR